MRYVKQMTILLAAMLGFAMMPAAHAAVTGTLAVTSSTHQENVSSTNSTVTLNWSGVTADNGSIVYEYVLDQSASTTTQSLFQSQFGATQTSTLKHANLGSATTVDLTNLVDGTWYFHIRAFDLDGIASGTNIITFGAIILDSAPTLSSTTPISPVTGSHASAISVTINGTKFMSGATVDLVNGASTVSLTNVVVKSDKQITATVPSGTAPATYDLRVTNAAPFAKQTTATAAYTSSNQTPVADPGADQNLTLNAGSSVVLALDGSASSDPDSDPLTFTWTTTADPSGSLNAQFTSATKNLTVSTAGTYTFSLKVNDGFIDSGSQTVNFVVTAASTNNPPVANAGADQAPVPSQTQVALSGANSSDPDNDALTYAWSFATANGKPSASQLTNTSILQPNGTSNPSANFTPDVSGTYTIELIVNDSTVDSTPDQVVITVNDKPTANAGTNQSNLPRNNLVTLDGSGSTDPENDALTYAWSISSQPSGSAITLSSTTAVKPTFTPAVAGSYVFGLVVTDALGNASASASTTVTVAAGFTITQSYVPGLNLVPMTVSVAGIVNASDLDAAIVAANSGVTVSQIFGWDAVNQKFGTPYINLGTFGSSGDFVLQAGQAYFVEVAGGNASLALNGAQYASLAMKTGLNLVAAPASLQSSLTHASNFAASISTKATVTASQIFIWDAANQRFGTPFVDLGTFGASGDFTLSIGTQGYFVDLPSAATYTP